MPSSAFIADFVSAVNSMPERVWGFLGLTGMLWTLIIIFAFSTCCFWSLQCREVIMGEWSITNLFSRQHEDNPNETTPAAPAEPVPAEPVPAKPVSAPPAAAVGLTELTPAVLQFITAMVYITPTIAQASAAMAQASATVAQASAVIMEASAAAKKNHSGLHTESSAVGSRDYGHDASSAPAAGSGAEDGETLRMELDQHQQVDTA